MAGLEREPYSLKTDPSADQLEYSKIATYLAGKLPAHECRLFHVR